MKKNVRYIKVVFAAALMLCGLNGCGSINNNINNEQSIEAEDKQIIIEAEDKQITTGAEDKKIVIETENKQIAGQDSSVRTEGTTQNAGQNNTENASSGNDLDVVVPDPADDDWYMKGNIFTDDKGNRLEVFFNDYGTLEFAVNGLSLYFTSADKFQQENNWKVYTCDDGTMIAFYPGEPAHLEICDGDHAGLYEAGGDKVN